MDSGQGMAISRNEQLNRQSAIEDAFFDALEHPIDEQITWVKSHYHDDDLINEVISLLDAHHGHGFLDSPTSNSIVDEVATTTTTQCPNLIGRTLGAYTVIRQINQGGMGRIYIAQRNDGEYDKVVAIKVVEVSGIDVSRFFQERQVLANFEHPNIVTLLDGGTLPEGFPYIVMEYVDGSPISEFVSLNLYSKKQIIELCIDLCNVTHQSHQHGVIHCDIKPANILVTPNADLKLLDFGIAQALVNTRSSEETQSSHPFALTPVYSSPQRHNQMPPHVADDIYSIGIVLGQLLLQKKLPKIQRVSRFKKTFEMADRARIRKQLHNRELRAIFHKATHENRDQRYSSADAFKNDLQNWLQNRPILALGRRPRYLIWKHLCNYWRWWLMTIIALAILYQPINIYIRQQQTLANKQASEQANFLYIQKRIEIESEAEDMLNQLKSLSFGSSILNIQEYTPRIKQTVENLQRWYEQYPDSTLLHQMLIQQKILLAKYIGHPYELSSGKSYAAQELYREALIEEYSSLKKSPHDEVIQVNIMHIKHQLAKFPLYSGAYQLSIESLNSLYNEANTLLQESDKAGGLIKRKILIPINLSRTHAYIQWGQLEQAKKLIKDSLLSLRNLISNDVEFTTLYQALFIEQKIHIHFLESNEGSLSFSYTHNYQQMLQSAQSLSLLKNNLQNTPQLLLMRIENTLACAALTANKAETAQHHLDNILKYISQVHKHNPNLPAINHIYSRYTHPTKPLKDKLQCATPHRYIFPLSPSITK